MPMVSRRSFLALTTAVAWQTRLSAQAQALPDCEWCGAAEAPGALTSKITLAGENEPGERLTVQGTVYAPDGMTPAPGVMLYLYHTNHAGHYAQRGGETGNGRRHGYLRGWLISDAKGSFEVRTILPGHYPNRSSPRHIHMTVKESGRAEYWIDDVIFAGDPMIGAKELESPEGRGGPGLVTTQRGPAGELIARRNVILWRQPA
jgi:protocatechuate 3,4-dioxygenase, beta subunit